MSVRVELFHGDCLAVLKTLDAGSVDAVVTDPPYPEIDRAYGRMTEAAWWDMMMGVCAETRRILKPTGSAVFILQPNSRKVGSMRGWLFEFQAWVCREWNMVQDVWWWNTNALPTGVCSPRERGLTRASVKACVWAGVDTCYRKQDAILMPSAAGSASRHEDTIRRVGRNKRETSESGQGKNVSTFLSALEERGGVIPFNCLPMGNNSVNGNHGHGAGTPLELAKWWTRYICPPGGTVLDPFVGSGTMGLAALAYGCSFVGIELDRGYFDIATKRIEEARMQLPLPLLEAL